MFKGATPVEETAAASPFKGVTAVEEAPAPAGGPKPRVLTQAGQAYRLAGADKTKAPEWYEELAGGLKHSLDSSALGLEKSVKWAANKIPGVNWEVDPENVENVERGKQFEQGTSGWSTAGKVGGDIAQGLAVGGVGGLAGAGKVLPAAVDIAANAGWGALTAPEDKGSAAAWGGGGAAFGHALPAAVGGLKKAGEFASDYVLPGRSVTRQLTKHLGKDEFARAGEAVRKGVASGDSMLPQTTAAMADSTKMAGIESGARGRGIVDFSSHDAAVDAAKKTAMTKLTGAADDVDTLTGEIGSIKAEANRRLGNMPLGKGRKEAVVSALEDLKGHQDIIAGKEGKEAIRHAIEAVNDPNSNTLILTKLANGMGDSAELTPIKNVLKEAAAERSKHISSVAEEGVKDVTDKLTAAQASRGLRRDYANQVGGKTREMTETSINRSLTRPGLSDEVVAEGSKFADELRKYDLHKTSTAPKDTDKLFNPRVRDLVDVVMAIKSGGLSLVTRAGSEFLDKVTRKKLDEVALRPEAFLKLVDAKQARGEALEAWEKKVMSAMKTGGTIGGAGGGAIGKQSGEENAP